jgi:hypothetical protein
MGVGFTIRLLMHRLLMSGLRILVYWVRLLITGPRLFMSGIRLFMYVLEEDNGSIVA